MEFIITYVVLQILWIAYLVITVRRSNKQYARMVILTRDSIASLEQQVSSITLNCVKNNFEQRMSTYSRNTSYEIFVDEFYLAYYTALTNYDKKYTN